MIGSGSLPISPRGQPNPVGDIWRIDVKLPVDGAIVPQSWVEPPVDFTAYITSSPSESEYADELKNKLINNIHLIKYLTCYIISSIFEIITKVKHSINDNC